MRYTASACGRGRLHSSVRGTDSASRHKLNNKHITHIMKKTLITLMSLAGIAFANEGVTYTSTPSSGTNASGYEARGFAFNLTGSALQTTPSIQGEALTELVTLETITFTTRDNSSKGEGRDGLFYIVITDDSLNILGWSDAAPEKEGSFTWSFENSPITLSKDKAYFAIAYENVSALQENTTLTAESTPENMQFGTNAVRDFGAGNLNFTDASNGKKTGLMYLNGGSYGINTVQTQYAPNVTIVTSAVTTTVPEPTTATLSLLALAGLASRRRRK